MDADTCRLDPERLFEKPVYTCGLSDRPYTEGFALGSAFRDTGVRERARAHLRRIRAFNDPP